MTVDLQLPVPSDWDLVTAGDLVPNRSSNYASLIHVLLNCGTSLVGYWYPLSGGHAHGSMRVLSRGVETTYARTLEERKNQPHIECSDVLEYQYWEQEIPAGPVIGTSALSKDQESNDFCLAVTADIFSQEYKEVFTLEFINWSLEHAELFQRTIGDMLWDARIVAGK